MQGIEQGAEQGVKHDSAIENIESNPFNPRLQHDRSHGGLRFDGIGFGRFCSPQHDHLVVGAIGS